MNPNCASVCRLHYIKLKWMFGLKLLNSFVKFVQRINIHSLFCLTCVSPLLTKNDFIVKVFATVFVQRMASWIPIESYWNISCVIFQNGYSTHLKREMFAFMCFLFICIILACLVFVNTCPEHVRDIALSGAFYMSL